MWRILAEESEHCIHNSTGSSPARGPIVDDFSQIFPACFQFRHVFCFHWRLRHVYLLKLSHIDLLNACANVL